MKFKRVNVAKRYFGGGGGSTSTVPTIPDWAVPYAQDILGETKNLYTQGKLSNVPEFNQNMIDAGTEGAEGIKSSTRANEAILSAQMGRLTGGALDGNKGMQDAYVTQKLGEQTSLNNQSFGANGTLGSARNVQANANAAAKISADSAQQIFNNQVTVEKGIAENAQNQLGLLTNATNTVAGLGEKQWNYQKVMNDSNYEAISRAAGIFTGATPKEQIAPQGGGK